MLKQTDRRNLKQSGFTLMEMLVTVLIIICLLALSFVAITRYIRHVQITELDNAAREIYMAAQNQAILLKSSGELEDLVIRADNRMDDVDVTPNSDNTVQITAYYISSGDSDTIKELLPKTSIEEKLWDGHFYIVYEPVSGSVIDVFYAKNAEAFAEAETTGFRDFYDKWRAAPKEDRMNNKPMIGYYGGDSAESGNSLSLRTPVINIYNEDVLRAEVTYWIPRSLSVINSGSAGMPEGGVKLDVNLLYEGKEIPLELPLEPSDKIERDETLEYTAIKYTWELDTLQAGNKFIDLFRDVEDINGQPVYADDLIMGKDFTITAAVSYEGIESGLQVNGARKSAADNSLFAKESGGATAKIAYMRHLQNLDAAFSKVEGKTAARQIADITCDSSYNFIPVENGELKLYNGDNFRIRELNVNADTTAGRTAYGLFGNADGKAFSDIRLVNARVNGGANPTGVLVGSGQNMTIKDCGVYWENTSATETNLRSVLGDSDRGIIYKVKGTAAGGLAGQMTGGQIIRSFAATTIEGTGRNGIAGGLVGSASGNLTIKDSYGGNYLTGKNAAGLIGNLSGRADVEDSYATGFIRNGSGDKAAGFCLGNNGIIVSNRAYSTMLFSKDATNYPLNPKDKDNSYTNTYYLMSGFFKAGNFGQAQDLGRDYATLTDPDKIVNLYGEGNKFQMKTTRNTFPYNLQTTLNLTSYSYPGLRGMDHYGDWGAEFQNGSLVYYERYEDEKLGTAYAFNGGNLSMITDDYAVEDGYALAFLSTGDITQLDASVKITYRTSDSGSKTETLRYSMSPGANEYQMQEIQHYNEELDKNETYYLLPLPSHIVNSSYAAKDFYQKIEFSQGSGNNKVTGEYYYNPHFANAVIEYNEDLNLKAAADEVQVQIRTARHLNMLSKYSEYYASNHQYDFVQSMNIDYSIYEGYNLFPMDEDNKIRIGLQEPIGEDKDKPFRGRYHGEYHTIENVGIKSNDKNYIGLFGYSTGDIENTTYIVNEKTVGKISSDRILGDVYVGGLAGYNGGTITNCAVAGMEIDAKAYNFSTVYAGGLVGWNRGTIQSSSAALTELTLETNLANGYAGGFVGLNTAGGTVKQCYTVGRVDVEQSKFGDVYVCGFAGSNSGTIRQCYAASDLETSGEIKTYGFCQDESDSGTYDKNYYMNNGNFRYDGVNYTAQYEDRHAEEKKYGDFTNADTGLPGSLSMSAPKQAKQYKKTESQPDVFYPYPGVVKDANGQYIHYGLWPELMNLNRGGIYYWEKMVSKDAGGKDKVSYHMSAIILDPDNPEGKTIEKVDTLSTKHSDGGVITEYGYGYFAAKGIDGNGLSSQGVSYYDGKKNIEQQNWPENEDCNRALAALMEDGTEDNYDFHSYNTWGTAEDEKGLYLTGTDNALGYWTLSLVGKDANKYDIGFYINPFFADSISLSGNPNGWSVDSSVSTVAPGNSKAEPFYVRSVAQLQFINWNGTSKNTSTVLREGTRDQFPFLGYLKIQYNSINGAVDRKYYWKQSHDLHGGGKTYTPIAELYDHTDANQSKGMLYGWFGGTYDGDDYVIQDVNIEGQGSCAVGLFGMVYDGSLKNIIMYSPNGDGTVTSRGESVTTEVPWHAIGGLTGFAATSSEATSAIENCSIAGYTVKDNHYGSKGWGGTCMGGLIGVSCMDLEKCTAVAELENRAVDNDNVRIGGLVGSCQKSISACYAGGNIDVTGAVAGSDRGIYAGGVVGGVYFKPLRHYYGDVGGKQTITNTLKDCYSYVTLPAASTKGKDGKSYVKALYAVGGPGEISMGGSLDDKGYTIYDNCYYLENVTWIRNNGKAPTNVVRCDIFLQNVNGELEPAWPDQNTKYNNEQIHALSYDEMSGMMFDALKDAGFTKVTTVAADGNTINGKYSLTSDPSLTGQNYPFPTILTQNDDGEIVNVHYGAWPIEGLSRQNGSVPAEIDLFADYIAGTGAFKTEEIKLSDLIDAGGELTYKIKDEGGNVIDQEAAPVDVRFDKATFGEDRKVTLTLTGKRAGLAQIEIEYKVNGKSYYLLIDAQVTAKLQLLPEKSPAKLFTSETALVELKMSDKDGRPLNEELLQEVKVNTETAFVERDGAYLEDAGVIQSTGDEKIMLMMTTLNKKGPSKVTLNYTYDYRDGTYEGTDPISIEIATPTIILSPLDIYLDGLDEKVVKYGAKEEAEEKIGLTVDDYTPQDISITDMENGENVGLVFAKWSEELNEILLIHGYGPQTATATGVVRLKLRFTLDGVIHESWQYLQVNVHPGGKTD